MYKRLAPGFVRRTLLPLSILVFSMLPAAGETPEEGQGGWQTHTATLPPAITAPRRKINENALTILGSGRLTSYTQFAEDISVVIEGLDGNKMRVVPLLGKSAAQNVMDLLDLNSTDMALADQDVLNYLRRKNPKLFGDVDKHIYYIAKLFNAELHVYAKVDVKSLEDLAGKKISCLKEGSTAAALCHNLFEALKIKAEVVYDSSEMAHQKVLSGEIAAAVDGAPAFDKVKPEEGLHFVPISEESLPNSEFNAVRALYLPARLTHEMHPNMIPQGEDVPTIASSSLLVAYAWPPGSAHYQRLEKFVQMFFDNLAEFRRPPRHPKWAEVNLAAEVPGWRRFPPAQRWLEAAGKSASQVTAASGDSDGDAKMRAAFVRFLEERTAKSPTAISPQEREVLFSQFVKWWEKAQKPR